MCPHIWTDSTPVKVIFNSKQICLINLTGSGGCTAWPWFRVVLFFSPQLFLGITLIAAVSK